MKIPETIYEELPKKWKAIRKIRKSSYYGNDGQDLAIEYIYSHAFWWVGSNQGFINLCCRCVNEVKKLEEKCPAIKHQII